MKRILPKKLSALALAVVSVPAVWSQSTPPALGDAAKVELDSINAGLDQYESMARRSILSGGSKPVSFAGEAIGRIIGSTYRDYPDWMQADATTMKNSFATLRMGMVAAPSRNLRLWSKVAFSNALLGSTASPSDAQGDGTKSGTTLPTGYYRSPTTGEAGFKIGSLVFEDMCAGAVAKIGPTTWSFKAGGVLWNELSPLTVWKVQPRIFSWDYLPFELEQSTAQFYDYGTVKGEKSGRAAWNKKPFQGLQLESVELPLGLYANGMWGFYEGYNKNQPWLIPNDKNTELQMIDTLNGSSGTTAYRSSSTKGFGIGDGYRWSYFLRLAKSDLPGGMTVGGNLFAYYVDPNYPKQWGYEGTTDLTKAYTGISVARDVISTAKIDSAGTGSSKTYTYGIKTTSGTGRQYSNNYYVIPKVGSIDFRRNIPGGLNFHVDIAMSHADSVFYKVSGTKWASAGAFTADSSSTVSQVKTAPTAFGTTASTLDSIYCYRPGMRENAKTADQWEEIGRTTSGWIPGVYADISYPFPWLEAELRSVVLPKKFQSPASVANPMDGIFPYESNMTGAGKFAGEDNGTAYASNLAGSNLILKIPVPRGHAKVSWGLHGQMEAGRDMVYFPWRQNGEAYSYSLASDFTQYDQGLLNDYLMSASALRSSTTFKLRQAKRLGDEFYASLPSSMRNIYAPTIGDAGGERGTYLSVYEGFVPYKLTKSWINVDPTDSNAVNKWNQEVQPIKDNLVNGTVPTSQKFTQNLSFDATYEISRLWEGKRSVFLGGYVAFNSITKDNRVGVPAFSSADDNVLLMGRELRFEPVFQVTPKFYLIGLIGNEIWSSRYGVAYVDTSTGKAPSDDALNALVRVNAAGATNVVNAASKAFLVRAPIDYNDWIYGLGFNWDMASRVSLNFRCQYFTHQDKGISVDVPKAQGINDYKAWLTMAEVKMWF